MGMAKDKDYFVMVPLQGPLLSFGGPLYLHIEDSAVDYVFVGDKGCMVVDKIQVDRMEAVVGTYLVVGFGDGIEVNSSFN